MVCLGRRPCLPHPWSRAKSALPGSRVSSAVRASRDSLLAARRVSRGGPTDPGCRKVERRPGRAHPWTLRYKYTVDDRLAVVQAMDHLPTADSRRRRTRWRKQFRAGRDRCVERTAANSIVVHLWKEVAPTLRRHVEEATKRVGKIAGAMVLFRSGLGKADLLS